MMVVLFDLEGTLVQTIENDEEAIFEFRIKTREKLLELGIPNNELKGIIASTLARNKAIEYVKEHFSKREANRFHLEMDKFLKKCELKWADVSKIFPDTLPTLNRLREFRYRMGLITNTSREAANRMLSMHDMGRFFEVVITREDVKKLKPDPEGIVIALSRLNTRDFIYIGDLIHDSQAAENANGISIIVNRDPLKTIGFNADFVIKSLMEIPNIVQSLRI